MSATAPADTVTLAVDGRELTVPKGTPLVLAAAAAGIEIPVFCYEPRLGPAVGACRMCLVEVEGMPKLQAACTMTATDGMKVHTRNAKASEGQAAVLEFLLINHPLDCPVCDKGGECPLQDLTYRYGPGNTRFALPKRTYEKPIAVSPLIALDRERCILCYRCTRFSSDVAEDEQLIARERGASSVIATFEEKPYVGGFSGNVVELCPVGALTATEYRFRARPWEIVNVPTVCGLCPTGCNTWATVREREVQRVLSRNHPEVDEGWLCDKGRFAVRHLTAPDRHLRPLLRDARGAQEPVTWEAAAESVGRRLRHYVNLYGPDSVAIVASGEQTNEEAFAWARLAEVAGGATLVGAGDAAAAAYQLVDPYAARIADLDHADLVVVAGERQLVDAAGVLELRVRQAVRRGAELVLAGPGGTLLDRNATARVPATPGRPQTSFFAVAGRLAAAERPVLILTDPVDLRLVARLAHDAGLHEKAGGVLAVPLAPNGRGVRLAGFDADPELVLARAEAGTLRLLVLLGDADPAGRWPQAARWAAAAARVESLVVQAMFPSEAAKRAHVVLPATAALEKEGTFTNLEGRTQRLRPTLVPPDGVADEISFLGAAVAGLGGSIEGSAPRLHRQLVAARPAFNGSTWEAAAEHAPLERRTPGPAADPGPVAMEAAVKAEGLQLVATRSLFSGPAVEHTPRLHFQDPGEVVVAHADARRLGLRGGQVVAVQHAGGRTEGPLRISRSLTPGTVRISWAGPPVGGRCTVEAAGT